MYVVWLKTKWLAFHFCPLLVRLSAPAHFSLLIAISNSSFCLINAKRPFVDSYLSRRICLLTFAVRLFICFQAWPSAQHGGSHFGCCRPEFTCRIGSAYLGSLVLGSKPIDFLLAIIIWCFIIRLRPLWFDLCFYCLGQYTPA